MIDNRQIRTARALLKWSTGVLAEKTNLTVNGLNKIERGHVRPLNDTLDRIQTIFEKAGVEFLPGSGVQWKSRLVTVYEGSDASRWLASDIWSTLKKTGGEILIAFGDEGAAMKHWGVDFMKDQMLKRKKAGISHRILVCEGDPNRIPGILASGYRSIPASYFSQYPVFIYEAKLALLCQDAPEKTIVIHDARLADSVRKLFNFVWDDLKPQESDVATPKGRRKKKAND